jgi:hypothetical protein
LGEGGTVEDLEVRRGLLRCGWGVVRDMGWFLDTLLGYMMTDVVDVEFRRLKNQLGKSGRGMADGSASNKGTPLIPQTASNMPPSTETATIPASHSAMSINSLANTSTSAHLDFATLRHMHNTYLERLLTGCLLFNPALTAILRSIFEICERFVAQVERWGGDVLPALLFEGSLAAGNEDQVGAMVKERWTIVAGINEVLLVTNSYGTH